MKILVIQQKMIGDVLTSSILFEVLRKSYPNAQLHYAVNKHTIPVVQHHPFIDKLVVITPEIENSKRTFYQFLKKIKSERYDTVIDIYAKLGSYLMTYFSKAKTRIGYKKSYSKLLYTHYFEHKLTRSQSVNLAYENRLMLLQPLVKTIDYSVTPKIFISEDEKKESLSKFHNASVFVDEHPYIMINVLGSETRKTYPLNYMAILLDTIVANHPHFKLLLNYMPKQQDSVTELLNYCKPETKQLISTYYAPSLREFIVLTSFCRMLIGNEGGAIHMAKAVNVPTFAIFSPWIRTETWGKANEDTKNEGVHLRDFKPELFSNYNQQQFKEKALHLYQEFQPELITKKLNQFIEINS